MAVGRGVKKNVDRSESARSVITLEWDSYGDGRLSESLEEG